MVKIVAISGSLRAASFNTGLLRSAQLLAPKGVEFIIANVSLPLYNTDIELSPPPEVIAFQELVKSADAVLLASPEHNYLPSAVIKNAIDWGTRSFPASGGGPVSVWNDKPAALISAGGGVGGLRAQYVLRQTAVFLNLHVLNKPEVGVQIWGANQIFDPVTGDVTDEPTKTRIKDLLDALVSWTTRLTGKKPSTNEL
eukprot:CAMPEP_0196764870 /NCGR_PEP_ID=MMETSP1095-20130614/7049_1 /TAXON_ID=96789 ORGANISM="Chromulina nebulosa, Strain UTEXLB2642" /NCGR_SAMPLE_ID=MMETSP1095 /ASSEMBLY_ACC=CAM_ASM_000446 /LENGTH=197 /DNA_ID=CAMNT_0042121559 /DNA_START=32 /DNA_END=625 /DNA_ORIENTATION=-